MLENEHRDRQRKLEREFNKANKEAEERAKALAEEAAEEAKQRMADLQNFIKEANTKLGALMEKKTTESQDPQEEAPKKHSTKPTDAQTYEKRMVELVKSGVEAKRLAELMDVKPGTLRSWVLRSERKAEAEACIKGEDLTDQQTL